MFEIKDLPYKYDALEPIISTTTVNIHYNKHEKGYLDRLNKFLSEAGVCSRREADIQFLKLF